MYQVLRLVYTALPSANKQKEKSNFQKKGVCWFLSGQYGLNLKYEQITEVEFKSPPQKTEFKNKHLKYCNKYIYCIRFKI